jgi:hypothetical protein
MFHNITASARDVDLRTWRKSNTVITDKEGFVKVLQRER